MHHVHCGDSGEEAEEQLAYKKVHILLLCSYQLEADDLR